MDYIPILGIILVGFVIVTIVGHILGRSMD